MQDLEEMLIDRNKLLQHLKDNIQQEQNRMQQHANAKRHDLEFLVGDLVLLRLQPYRQTLVDHRKTNKLAKR